MIDISPNNLDIIAMRDKVVVENEGFLASLGDLGGINEQAVLDLLRNLKAGGGFLTGTLTTTNATPASFEIVDTMQDSNVFLSSNIIAECKDKNEYGAFIRNAGYKNVDGAVSVMDQIQDVYTMRSDADWRVDYKIAGTKVYLRVWGEAAKTIIWSFKINLLTTIK
jgi:hypothetical protein